MKLINYILKYFPALMSFWLLPSCTSDNFEAPTGSETNHPTQKMKYFVNFQLEAVGQGTRATNYGPDDDLADIESGDFVDGLLDEHTVGSDGNYAIFFEKNDKLWKVVNLALANQVEGEDFDGVHYEACYTATFTEEDLAPFDLTEPSDDFELHVLIVVNANDNLAAKLESLSEGDSIDEVFNIIDDAALSEVGSRGGLMTMTNAIYVGNGNSLLSTAKITKDNIQERPFFDRDKVVHVAIERLLAKFSFSFTGATKTGEGEYIYSHNNEVPYCYDTDMTLGDHSGTPLNTPVKWRAKVLGWGMNAFEKQEYAFRNVSPSANYFTGWYDTANRRAYWAEDPNYSGVSYPLQYRRSINSTQNYYAKNRDNNVLKNFSFTELTGEFGNVVYTPENTYDINDTYIRSIPEARRNKIAGTHFILCSELQLNIDGKWTDQQDLWRTQTGIYYSNAVDCLWFLVRRINNELHSQSQMKFEFFNWDSSTDNRTIKSSFTYEKDFCMYLDDYRLDTYDNLKAALRNKGIIDANGEFTTGHSPDDLFIPAPIKGGDGKVLPWFNGIAIKNAQDEPLYVFDEIRSFLDNNDKFIFQFKVDGKLYDASQETKVGINANTNPSYLQSLIFEWMGAVDHFSQGKMYYSAPARLSGTDSDADMRYGVLRNNWYMYRLSDITKIGTSVDNPDQPIVPDEIATEDQLNLTVKILDWHIFEIEAKVVN